MDYQSPEEKNHNLPPELVAAANREKPTLSAEKYLSNAPGDTFHDRVWREFWFSRILTPEVSQIWNKTCSGKYKTNKAESELFKGPEERKRFFFGRSDSVKEKIVSQLNNNKCTEDEAWKKFAINVHGRAHSFREDVDSGLAALGMLDADGKPTNPLGYRYVDSCEAANTAYAAGPRRLLAAALLQNANYSTLIHYIHRLTESKLAKDPFEFCTHAKTGTPKFESKDYINWLADELANNLGVMRTVTKRGGHARRPLQAELTALSKVDLIPKTRRYRAGAGLIINWSALEEARTLEI